MIIESTTIHGGKCHLTLPYFKEDNKNELSRVHNMNTFIKSFSEEALKFTETDQHVRRYCTDYTTSEKNGIFTVIIHISARKLTDKKSSFPVKRTVHIKWRGAKLVSCRSVQSNLL